MEKGFVQLRREILNWEWSDEPNMVALFHYLIIKANHTDSEWHGVKIKRGQLIAGRDKLGLVTGLSCSCIRTCLKKLKNSGQIDIKSTNRFSVITVCVYDKYVEGGTDE